LVPDQHDPHIHVALGIRMIEGSASVIVDGTFALTWQVQRHQFE